MDPALWLGSLGAALGRGILAGLVGIAAMTLSQMIEMRISGRDPSSSPGDAAASIVGFHIGTRRERLRFSNVVHWLYGTAWGMVRGLLGLAGVTGCWATVIHFGLVWGVALLLLPGLKVAPPVREWGARSLMIDAFHHGVYAVTTGVLYDWIS